MIPGLSKSNLQDEILEYLCKQMHFSYDDETAEVKKAQNAKIDKLFSETFKLSRQNIVFMFEFLDQMSTILRRLEDLYKMNLDPNEIDESIFTRESRVI